MQEQHQVMEEETVHDCFISQLQDMTIQRPLEEKVIDNTYLSILAASNYAMHQQDAPAQIKSCQ